MNKKQNLQCKIIILKISKGCPISFGLKVLNSSTSKTITKTERNHVTVPTYSTATDKIKSYRKWWGWGGYRKESLLPKVCPTIYTSCPQLPILVWKNFTHTPLHTLTFHLKILAKQYSCVHPKITGFCVPQLAAQVHESVPPPPPHLSKYNNPPKMQHQQPNQPPPSTSNWHEFVHFVIRQFTFTVVNKE